MPMMNSSIYGLIILSIGILGIIVSLLITEARRFTIAVGLAGFVVLMGLYQYVGTGVRQWQTSRRIGRLQDQQRQNLEALQARLRQAQEQSGSGVKSPNAPPAPPPRPVPVPPKKK